MNKFIIFAGIIVLSLTACSSNATNNVAKTNAGNITKEEFYDELKDTAGEDTLQRMVLIEILEDKYEANDEEIDERIDSLKDEIGEGEQFDMWMEQQGFDSEDALRDQIYPTVLEEKALMEEVDLNNDEIKEKYVDMKTEINTQHILVNDEDIAKKVKKKIDDGEKFADLAKEYSSDDSANEGGDLGYFDSGDMVPEFEETAFNMDEGDVSDPIKTQYGFHIIKINDIRDKENFGSFEDMKDDIKRNLLNEKLEADPSIAEDKITNILKSSDIHIEIKGMENLFDYVDKSVDNPEERIDLSDDNDSNNVNKEKDKNEDTNESD